MKRFFPFLAIALMMALVGCKPAADIFETEQYTLQEVYYLTPGVDDSLNIDMSVELPTRMASDSLLSAMLVSLKSDLFGEAFSAMEPQHALEAYAAMLKTEYIANNADPEKEYLQSGEIDTEFTTLFCEVQYLAGQVMSTTRGVLSYGVERYVYAGGFHGQNFRLFFNYCLRSGQVLHFSDFFVEGCEDALRELIIQGLIAQKEDCTTLDDLVKCGYWVDQIRPTDNFYLADDGIVFVYNQYDIAPYAEGESSAVLSWDDLKPYLQPWLAEQD